MNIFDILNHGIKIEKEGAEFYNLLFNQSSSEHRRQIFQTLMREENNHAKLFYDMLNQAKSIFNIEEVNEKIDFKIEDIFKEKDFAIEEHTFDEIINHAIATEYNTIEYYTEIIDLFTNEKEKKVIDAMIKEEEKHVLKLKEMIFYEKLNITKDDHCGFIDTLINNMDDLVQVIDNNDNIIFTNAAMNKAMGRYLVGKKRTESLSKDIEKIHNGEDKLVIYCNGRYYSLISSPIRNQGRQDICIEVFRDITKEKEMENKIVEQNKKFVNELEISRKMQYSLLPSKLDFVTVEAEYYYNPCEKIGGDLFDIYRIDEHHIGLCICDVSGHGVPAALVTMFLSQNIDKTEISPSKILHKLYSKFLELNFNDEIYITVFLGIIDVRNGLITFSNAGHQIEPLVFNKGKEEISLLKASGMPVCNWFKGITFNEKQYVLSPQDCIFLLTDGLIELKNENKMLGIDEVKKLIYNNKDKDINEIKQLVENMINNYCDDISQLSDDITFLLVKIK